MIPTGSQLVKVWVGEDVKLPLESWLYPSVTVCVLEYIAQLCRVCFLICKMRAVLSACGTSGKEPTRQHRRWKRCGLDSWVGKIPWRRAEQPTPVFLPGESYEQMSLVGYSPRSQAWLKQLNSTDEQPAKEIHSAREHRSFCPCGTGVHHPPNTWVCSPTQKLPKLDTLGISITWA